MSLLEDIMEILRKEYGINSPAELDEALAKQERIDISPFCTPPKEVKRAG